MGGSGSAMAAIQVMRNNKKLLSKRKKGALSFVSNSTEKTEYNLPKASAHQLKALKERLQEENRQRRKTQLIVLMVFMLGLTAALIYLL